MRNISNGHSDSGSSATRRRLSRSSATRFTRRSPGSTASRSRAGRLRSPKARSGSSSRSKPGAASGRARPRARAWRLEGRRMLAAYLTPERLQVEPLAIECQLRCVLPSGATLSGRADRIDQVDGGIEIVDYKTGRRTLTEGRMRTLSSVQVYVVSAQQMFGQPVKAISFHYLRDNKVLRLQLDEREVAHLTKVLDNLAISQMPTVDLR
ncbi:MAG: PD-(D/E)XK nuclease family protein [Baekduia sp.]